VGHFCRDLASEFPPIFLQASPLRALPLGPLKMVRPPLHDLIVVSVFYAQVHPLRGDHLQPPFHCSPSPRPKGVFHSFSPFVSRSVLLTHFLFGLKRRTSLPRTCFRLFSEDPPQFFSTHGIFLHLHMFFSFRRPKLFKSRTCPLNGCLKSRPFRWDTHKKERLIRMFGFGFVTVLTALA